MDVELASPFGLRPGERLESARVIAGLAARLLPELAHLLNDYHHVNHALRYWEIVLGHWLLRYVAVVYSRYLSLDDAIRRCAISGTTIFEPASYSLATANSAAFVSACDDDIWSHVLYARIIEYRGGVRQEMLLGPLDDVSGFGMTDTTQAHAGQSLKRRLPRVASTLLSKLRRDDDALFISTYLPLRERLALELSFGQCPQVSRTPPLPLVKLDRSARRQCVLDSTQFGGLERFLRLQISDTIPTCYVEGYNSLQERAAALDWPASPKLIFTSNAFDTDELFKVWAGAQVEKGTPYITGQHGNNYGTHFWGGADFWPERTASDRFVTWGWTDGNVRTAPAFLFRTAGRRRARPTDTGGLLLVEMPVSHRVDPQDNYAEFAVYQDEQFRFVEALPAPIQSAVTVRLHSAFREFPWGEEERWHDRSPSTRLELGRAPINKLIKKNRLVVHSYDSTGILETLALNKPTLCFWHGGYEHLIPSARPYYELLTAAGILHHTPEDAAAAVATHWDDVTTWWNGATVQTARRDFCEQYARTVDAPVRVLRGILRRASRRPTDKRT